MQSCRSRSSFSSYIRCRSWYPLWLLNVTFARSHLIVISVSALPSNVLNCFPVLLYITLLSSLSFSQEVYVHAKRKSYPTFFVYIHIIMNLWPPSPHTIQRSTSTKRERELCKLVCFMKDPYSFSFSEALETRHLLVNNQFTLCFFFLL